MNDFGVVRYARRIAVMLGAEHLMKHSVGPIAADVRVSLNSYSPVLETWQRSLGRRQHIHGSLVRFLLLCGALGLC
eukprot:6056248-Amphidinium_carterae.1